MKHLSFLLPFLSALIFSADAIHAQAVSSAAFGSTVAVWSGHTTVRERVDAGVNERIELWNRTWIVSPSGQTYANTDHWGFNAPDGYAATTITFNEVGRWSYWASDGGSVDSFVYGDGPYDWYIWPHNPPNGVGYGGWGRRLTTYIDVAASNNPPTISWTTTPGTVVSGQSYTITAHGHDPDGNLTQVNVWKNGVGFAFAGGGDGTDGNSGNTTADTGPATITFTANAVDSDGVTSATISQTVTIGAANNAPTIAWTAIPGSVDNGQSYTISAHGHDPDGNMVQVNVWKNGVGFAFAGGGDGTDGDSGNTTTDSGPATITFTANAVDSNGVSSSTISQTVTIGAPPAVTVLISASPTSATAPGSATITWSSANATAVAVSGSGVGSSATSGSQAVNGLPAGTYTYTITAQGSGGPATQSATFTVTPPANNAPTIAWNATPGSVASGQSYTVSAHGHDADGNLTEVNVWKNGVPFAFAGGGNGTDGDSGNPTSDSGPTTLTFTANAVDSLGATSGTISQTVTVSAPNRAPTAVLTGSTTLQVNEVGSWNFSAADQDGNLSAWRFYASTNPGAAWSAASGGAAGPGSYSVSFPAPGTYTWIVDAQDAAGATSSASLNVTVSALPGVTASISASPGSSTAPGSTTISWTSANATSVSVSGSGVGSSAASGSQTVTGLAAGTYTYALTAQGFGGPVTQSATFTVLAANRTVALSVSPVGTGFGTGAGIYAEGSSATLTAMPDATHVFTGWSGDLSGTANPLTFTVGAQNYNVVANFALRLFAVTASVSPAGAGSVTGAGNYTLGATATLSATSDATHVFTAWSGDISGSANPVSFVVSNATNVIANFAAASFALTTAASSGGGVTPGGTYPAGAVVTITATPDSTHRFTAWTGDASGAPSTIAVTLDRARFAQANFTAKAAQTIAFDPPGDRGLTSPPFALTASAPSGLPVSFLLLSGPAILTGNSVQVTGAGPVTLQANQPGDAFFLPAVPVNRTFNVIAAATLKYRGQSRTLLRDETTREAPPFVLEKP